jgi:hypothetical protein
VCLGRDRGARRGFIQVYLLDFDAARAEIRE